MKTQNFFLKKQSIFIDYYTYNFNDLEKNINNIKLIWNNPIGSTSLMFKDCNKIIEIDLSKFIHCYNYGKHVFFLFFFKFIRTN